MVSTPEFSRLISIEGITPDKLRKESVEATPEECAALVARFDLRALSGLKAKLRIRRVAGGDTVQVAGDFEADVVQGCVVSLHDVPSRVIGSFETFFTENPVSRDDLEFSEDDGADAAEMVSNGMIDLGEMVSQYLALELDPYPRAPGVNFAAQLAKIGGTTKHNPFLVLKDEEGEG